MLLAKASTSLIFATDPILLQVPYISPNEHHLFRRLPRLPPVFQHHFIPFQVFFDSRRISKNWEMEMVTKATSEDERRHSQASRLLLLDAGEQLDARQRWPQWQRERNMAELFANPVPRP